MLVGQRLGGSSQEEVQAATNVLNQQRAIAATAKIAAKQAADKAARTREMDVTLTDNRLVEHYQVCLPPMMD